MKRRLEKGYWLIRFRLLSFSCNFSFFYTCISALQGRKKCPEVRVGVGFAEASKIDKLQKDSSNGDSPNENMGSSIHELIVACCRVERRNYIGEGGWQSGSRGGTTRRQILQWSWMSIKSIHQICCFRDLGHLLRFCSLRWEVLRCS